MRASILGRFRAWLRPAPGPTTSRLAALDILRGVAILLVLCFHAPVPLPRHPALAWGLFRANLFGWAGVDLFFVLSGFLVGGLLIAEVLKRGELDVRRFLIRRGLKIWPAYYIYLLVLGGVVLGVIEAAPPGEVASRLIPNLLHFQNYAYTASLGDYTHTLTVAPRGHTWTLAVEEHFYLALTFLVFALLRGRGAVRERLRALPWIGAAVMVLCLAARYWQWHRFPGEDDQFWYYPTHLRADSLFAGVVLAYFYHCRPERFARWERLWPLLLIVGLVGLERLAVYPRSCPFVRLWGFTAVYLACACLLVGLLGAVRLSPVLRRGLQLWPGRVLAFIGCYSYSIYLWHWDLGLVPAKALAARGLYNWLPAAGDLRTGVMWVGYLVLALGGGILAGRLIEAPFLAWRDRLYPPRSRALADAETSPPAATVPAPTRAEAGGE